MKFFNLLMLSLLFSTGILKSQSFFNSIFNLPVYHTDSLYKGYYDRFTDSFALAMKISRIEQTIVDFNKNGKKTLLSKQNYHIDQNGRLVEVINTIDSGRKFKILKSGHQLFNEKGKLLSSDVFFYGNRYYTSYSYNDSDRITKEAHFGEKKLDYTINNIYDDQNMLSSTTYLTPNGRVSLSYSYFYYPDKNFRQIIHKGRKGKTIRVWDYSCDETGKSVKRSTDTAKVCTIKSYLPDGMVISTTQSFKSNGMPWKTITYTDSFKRMLKHEYYAGKNLDLKYIVENNFLGKNIIRSKTRYNQSTSTYWEKLMVYDLNGRITTESNTWFKRNKIDNTYSSSYVYNTNGLVTSKTISLNNRIINREYFKYDFYSGR